MCIPALALVALLISVPAAAQIVHVPDVRAYGMDFGRDAIDPTEIDGDPSTLEFVIYRGGQIVMLNPRKVTLGAICIEPVLIPKAFNTATVAWVQWLRNLNGRTFVVTLAYDIFTGTQGYDVRPLTFDYCSVETHQGTNRPEK